MTDDEIDAILHANRMRRARAPHASAPRAEGHEPAEGQTPLAAMQRKLGAVPRGHDGEEDDLAIVLAESRDARHPRTRAVIVSRRHGKIVGEHG
jgi:hypothetical protein